MDKHTVVMQFEKSTKNTHKYKVTGGDVPQRAFNEIYIQKSAMPQPAKQIKVTVEVVDPLLAGI